MDDNIWQVTRLTTPLGPFTALLDAEGVRAAGFTDDANRLLALLPRRARDARLAPAAPVEPAGPLARRVADGLERYFDGELAALDDVPVSASGTAFQNAAWAELRAIPAGTTIDYTELAGRTGNPRAVRAAGSACAHNPVGLIVPCHRVVRADGRFGGYLYGLDRKEALLAHERKHA
jgi:methylated-DNA-[protein]-cysteine S-methyltransferase